MKTKERQYIIQLESRRSLLALVASLISLFFAIYAITSALITQDRNGGNLIEVFRFFTVISNIIAAVASSMIIPYAIEGFRKTRFDCPRWTMHFFYIGATCTTLTMLFTLFIISFLDFGTAFRGHNFYLHLICPTMILISFFIIESHYKFTLKDSIICMIPILIYFCIYLYEAVYIGENNGGWKDMYYVTWIMPVPLSITIVVTLAIIDITLLRFIYNKLLDMRVKNFINHLWDKDVHPAEIKMELFGLGRYMGRFENKYCASLPLDIINIISEKYKLTKDELIKPFMKGMMDSISELDK